MIIFRYIIQFVLFLILLGASVPPAAAVLDLLLVSFLFLYRLQVW